MTSNKNKKIPYPPEIPDYISTRLLKEKLLDFLRANGKPEKVNDIFINQHNIQDIVYDLYVKINDKLFIYINE